MLIKNYSCAKQRSMDGIFSVMLNIKNELPPVMSFIKYL